MIPLYTSMSGHIANSRFVTNTKKETEKRRENKAKQFIKTEAHATNECIYLFNRHGNIITIDFFPFYILFINWYGQANNKNQIWFENETRLHSHFQEESNETIRYLIL